ncbi:steroid 17-alpha-hydroxylase/17,20 lyase-like [Mercenaria mercenaria]|uniref:steroid 17-alpha-hydroxylase/17,20 lyase-like n=1 Tax=Mercenaria mercenaria TaxID=6596 RepID=UPI00234E8FD3|nr:steroid 17-alpha-hydroxylase/17,20 lyase-like [Mercenaria mercenaria]XP_053404204.1 steroid 17-alpha-hydroxylase/17,20 lyase-like [Mercenaria mercenaria]
MLEFLVPGSITSTCIVGLVAGLIVYWAIQKWKYKYPPGPTGLPLLGNALQIDQSKLHEQAFEWSKKYGPVITIGTGPIPVVIVNTIETAMEVLVKRSTDFAGRQLVPSLDVLTYGGKDIAVASYSPAWKLHRKISAKALRHYMQGDALQNRVHDAVETAFFEIDQLSGEFDPSEYITFIVGNILTGLCFGGKYNFKDKEVKYIIEKEENMLKELGIGALEDFIPGLKYVYKSNTFKNVEKFVKDVPDGYITNKLREAEKTFDKDNVRHFTDTLILARMEAGEEEGAEILKSLTDQHLVQTLSDIFFAGTDTSKSTLKGAILHMVAFPDIQDKVQEEIDRAVGRERLPGINDRPNLSYTEAVLHESMRVGSVVPLGVPHMTICDTEIAGYRIPKGTTVIVNHWALHHDPDAWDDVDRFIPERYLDENGKLGPKPKNWLPFSAGKRACLGEFVAKPELHLLFACLMQRYKWRMISGKCPDLTEVGGINGLSYKSYKVIVEKRI